MSANSLDRRLGIDSLATKINELERMIRESRTTQVQGESAIQLKVSNEHVFDWSTDAGGSGGLIGTFVCTLDYDPITPCGVVYGDLEVSVFETVDDSVDHNLSIYYGLLEVDIQNDLYLQKLFAAANGEQGLLKIVRLHAPTMPAGTRTYYIHTRWRYIAVGREVVATARTNIIPDGPIL